MGRSTQTEEEIGLNLAEQLDWQFAERNDEGIEQALRRGEEIDAVYTLDEAGLLDGFFAFLKEAKIMEHWLTFSIKRIHHIFLPAIYFVLLYGVRVLYGIESTNALPSLLFSNVAVMTLIGFNAYQVMNGMTQRGKKLRTESSEYTLMDPQTLAEAICKTAPQELERLFNGTIHCLAAFGVFMAEVMVAVDGTQVATTPHFVGCGCLKVTKRKRTQAGIEVKEIELVFGWRLIALIDLATLIPLAIKIVQIQEHETPHLVSLVQQAQENLAPHSRIRWLVADRAYVDGPSLYELHRMGIAFVVIAKVDMIARSTALALSANAPIYERIELVRRGHGGVATTDEWLTRVIPVTGIRTWDNYRPPKLPGKRLSRKEHPALNAVVLTLWRNKPPSQHGARVYLTNAPVDNPWVIVDAYDDRSWIENGLFRNSKQFLRMTRWFPKKNDSGVRSHLTFVMLILATATAYRLWDKAQSGAVHHVWDHQIDKVTHRIVDADSGEVTDEPAPTHPGLTHLSSQIVPQLPTGVSPETDEREMELPPNTTEDDADNALEQEQTDFLAHSLLGGQGLTRWRRQLKREHRNKVIVFIGRQYAIFDLHYFLLLVGVHLRDPMRQQSQVPDVGRNQSGIP